MGWLLGWLGFGLLASYQAGEIAKHAASDAGAVMALVALVASVGCLLVLARQAVRGARPRQLLGALLIALAGLGGCFAGLYGGSAPAGGWVTTFLAASALLLLSLAIAAAGLLIAWRRLRVQEEQATVALIEGERRKRIDRILRESTPAPGRREEASLDDALDDDAYRLPTRPKWDEST